MGHIKKSSARLHRLARPKTTDDSYTSSAEHVTEGLHAACTSAEHLWTHPPMHASYIYIYMYIIKLIHGGTPWGHCTIVLLYVYIYTMGHREYPLGALHVPYVHTPYGAIPPWGTVPYVHIHPRGMGGTPLGHCAICTYTLGHQKTTGMYLLHSKATFGISRWNDLPCTRPLSSGFNLLHSLQTISWTVGCVGIAGDAPMAL